MQKKLFDNLSELPKPPNLPKATEKYNQFYSKLKKTANSKLYIGYINNNANLRNFLEHIFGISDFLSLCLLKNIDYFFYLLNQTPEEGLNNLLLEIDEVFLYYSKNLNTDISSENLNNMLMKKLRLIKQKKALLLAINDLTKSWNLCEIIKYLSSIADNIIKTSVNCLLLDSWKKKEINIANFANPGKNSGYFVLALGKLGGKELNYSSDVDLISLYDINKIDYIGNKTPHDCYVKITKLLVKLLSDRTEDGYVFRTDFRLRPDAGATPLALSVTAAETYYESIGQNWERAAMIKARPIGGDINSGNEFINYLKPFIWRKNLDYAAIADIKSIKRQIDTKEMNANFQFIGHNVKLGPGGIREIEFFTQTQQLIYGGRDPSIRTPSTISALTELERRNYITKEAKEELIASYIFFRIIEHRIQMIADEQSHIIPTNTSKLISLAVFSGFENTQSLEEEVIKYKNNVQKHYKKLFKDSVPLGSNHGNLVFTGSEDDPETLNSLQKLGFQNSKNISKIIREWHHSRYKATRSNRAREILTDMIPNILFEFSRTSNPEQSFKKFDNFLSKLPEGVQLFSLFQSNPKLLKLLAEIFVTSPYLSEFLENSPNVLDVLISDDFKKLNDVRFLEKDLFNLLRHYSNFQDILDKSRKWARERRFQIGIHLLRGQITGVMSSKLYSNLAISIIRNILKVTHEYFIKDHGKIKNSEFSIIGLGTLGSGEMQFGSDLDLIFVYDNIENIKFSNGKNQLAASIYFARLSKQFISNITSLTPEGKIYDIDMRLRPSGKSGPIATSLSSFEEYHKNSSWIWERMALTKAKVIAGDTRIEIKINNLIKKILSEPINKIELKKEVINIREKINKEHPKKEWQIKNSYGGLLDIQFISQYLQLANASVNKKILDQNNIEVFTKLKDNKIISIEMSNQLIDIANIQFNFHAIMSICYKDDVNIGKFSDEIYQKLFKLLNVNNKRELLNKFDEVQKKIRYIFDKSIKKQE